MILGGEVPGLLTRGWRFVASDAHHIADTVRQEFPEARLVCHEVSGQLGVANWYTPPSREDAQKIEKAAKQPVTAHSGMWLLALRMHEPGTEEPICGEPDQRVLQECRRVDQKRNGPVNARQYRRWAEAMSEIQAERRARQVEDDVGDEVEQGWYRHAFATHGRHGLNHIFVPSTPAAGRVRER